MQGSLIRHFQQSAINHGHHYILTRPWQRLPAVEQRLGLYLPGAWEGAWHQADTQ